MASRFDMAIEFSNYALGRLNFFEEYFKKAEDETGFTSVELARKDIMNAKEDILSARDRLSEPSNLARGKISVYFDKLLERLHRVKPLRYIVRTTAQERAIEIVGADIMVIDADMQMVAANYYFLENGVS